MGVGVKDDEVHGRIVASEDMCAVAVVHVEDHCAGVSRRRGCKSPTAIKGKVKHRHLVRLPTTKAVALAVVDGN